MGEVKEGLVTPPVSKRNFLKIGAALVGAALVGREAKIFHEQRVETSTGIFYSLYENHTTGLNKNYIPNDLDAFFREFSGKEYLDWPPLDILNNSVEMNAGINAGENKKVTFKVIDFPILQKLAQNHTQIILGDTSPALDIDLYRQQKFKVELVRSFGGAAVVATGLAYMALRDAKDKRQDATSNKKAGRRAFLTKSAIATGAVLAAPLIRNEIIHDDMEASGNRFDQKNAVQRILQRFGALTTLTTPEDHMIFFRSIVMADKIMTAAENLGKETGKKPKIAFHVGLLHSPIEDLLMAGHDFSRFLLSLYPKDYLQEIAEVNGSLENLCSARIITLNPNLTQEIVDRSLNEQAVATDRKIIDHPLLQTLQAKLSA